MLFLDSWANFELKTVSVQILKIGNITVGMRFQRNIKHSYYLWFWQFLVYYSYVPDCPKFQAISGTSYKLSRASCTDATHDCIQELNADITDISDEKYCSYSYVDILRVGTGTTYTRV